MLLTDEGCCGVGGASQDSAGFGAMEEGLISREGRNPWAPQLGETPETPPSSRAEGLLFLPGLESNPESSPQENVSVNQQWLSFFQIFTKSFGCATTVLGPFHPLKQGLVQMRDSKVEDFINFW